MIIILAIHVLSTLKMLPEKWNETVLCCWFVIVLSKRSWFRTVSGKWILDLLQCYRQRGTMDPNNRVKTIVSKQFIYVEVMFVQHLLRNIFNFRFYLANALKIGQPVPGEAVTSSLYILEVNQLAKLLQLGLKIKSCLSSKKYYFSHQFCEN